MQDRKNLEWFVCFAVVLLLFSQPNPRARLLLMQAYNNTVWKERKTKNMNYSSPKENGIYDITLLNHAAQRSPTDLGREYSSRVQNPTTALPRAAFWRKWSPSRPLLLFICNGTINPSEFASSSLHTGSDFGWELPSGPILGRSWECLQNEWTTVL